MRIENMKGRPPLSLEQLLELASKDQRSNSWVRKDYHAHRSYLFSLDHKMQNDGVALLKRARLLWDFRCHSGQLAIARMKDHAGRELLERRNRAIWGTPHVPAFEWLLEEARKNGLDETGQMRAVIDWALRPDLYEYRPGRPLKSRVPRQPPKESPKILAQKVRWHSVADPQEPLIGKARTKRYKIRINDFPEEALFSLADESGVIWDFDDWPTVWRKETA
jgi:hypothetical protein